LLVLPTPLERLSSCFFLLPRLKVENTKPLFLTDAPPRHVKRPPEPTVQVVRRTSSLDTSQYQGQLAIVAGEFEQFPASGTPTRARGLRGANGSC
jgi:hypothetical protein